MLFYTRLQFQVAQFFSEWKPRHHPQKRETVELVKNFLGTRGRKHGAITVQVLKKQTIYKNMKSFSKKSPKGGPAKNFGPLGKGLRGPQS